MRVAVVLVAVMLATACTVTHSVAEPSADSVSEEHWVEFTVASGLDAIEEAQGTPHILWFWGAN